MIKYMNKMVDNFSVKLNPNDTSPNPDTGGYFDEVKSMTSSHGGEDTRSRTRSNTMQLCKDI